VQVPVAEHGLADEVERVAGFLESPVNRERLSGVTYLTAGGWDDDMLFLVTKCVSVELGQALRLDDGRQADPAEWHRLEAAVEGLGYKGLYPPGWMVIPDVS